MPTLHGMVMAQGDTAVTLNGCKSHSRVKSQFPDLKPNPPQPVGSAYGDDTVPVDRATDPNALLPKTIEEAKAIETDGMINREIASRESKGFSSNRTRREDTYAIPGNGLVLCEECAFVGEDDIWRLAPYVKPRGPFQRLAQGRASSLFQDGDLAL